MAFLFRRLLAFAIILSVCIPAPEAAPRKKRVTKKRARTTRVVNKKPTFTGPMTDAEPFVVRLTDHPAPRGLDGRIIALWQSHGLYFDQGTRRWQWQRPRLFGTVEDLFTQGYVMPYLMPMLENAGAYVMSPRERDLSTTEIIIDTDGSLSGDFYLTEGKYKWTEGVSGSGFALPRRELFNSDNPFTMGTSEKVHTVGKNDTSSQSTAVWTADFPERGNYAVYVSYASYPNSATDAHYTVNHLGGTAEIIVNQKMGGSTWIYLGHFPFAKGKPAKPVVVLTNCSADKDAVVSADAVKIGGGMGNVARGAKGDSRFDAYTSGAPRFTEGARYWLQWAGMPESVYTESEGENDYTDDYKSRALWVNYLAGGSEMLPGKKGLGIPVDIALAFHTDAGTTLDGSVVGTLGIYSTDDGNLLGNGRTRLENKDLTDYVIGSVVSDIRALHRPDWTNRSIRDKKYYEIRETKVPAMIIELLSHQNFDDMKFGLDPRFRFDVSRAVYKGILRFLARRYDVPYIVQPLPVASLAITSGGSRRYRLSWLPTDDPLEHTAVPDYYIVEERIDNGAFREIATVKSPHYQVDIKDNAIHSYRIIAGNDGGRSFPSEVLSLYDNGTGIPDVNIVNGFTRISAPDCFDAGEYLGFNCLSDAGVPDGMDIISTGEQYEFRGWTEFVNNERPGFGASRSDMEKEITMGNTRDFVYIHGRAIRAAGKGFVSSSIDAFVNSEPSFTTTDTPRILDIVFGKQKEIAPGNGSMGTLYKTFTPQLQQRITAHCEAGGSLFVSGAYIGDDLFDNSFSDPESRQRDKAFANDILGYDWQVGKACVDGKVSVISSPFAVFAPRPLMFRTISSADSYGVESPDAIHPAGTDAFTIMRYDTAGLTAATALCRLAPASRKPYRVVAMGFPFETIIDESSRSALMTDLLRFLSHR